MRNKREYPYYLYHICREKDKYNFDKGYIGVSKHPKKRWNSGGYKINPHLSSALKKYDDIIHYVILCDTKNFCLSKERVLRPESNMGWNIAAGGSVPPSPKGTNRCVSKLPPEKRRKEYRVSEETKRKISLAQERLKPFHRERMTGDKNPAYGTKGKDRPGWKGWYKTPEGLFENLEGVSIHYGISYPAIIRRCKKGGVVGRNRWTPKEWIGKTWEELGWGFVPKDSCQSYKNVIK